MKNAFALVEVLIVVAILGILAAVVIPNVSGFLRTGNLAAANSEAAAVKTAAAAEYAETGSWEASSSGFYAAGYLDRAPEETYTFSTTTGLITGVSSSGKWVSAGFSFSTGNQTWYVP